VGESYSPQAGTPLVSLRQICDTAAEHTTFVPCDMPGKAHGQGQKQKQSVPESDCCPPSQASPQAPRNGRIRRPNRTAVLCIASKHTSVSCRTKSLIRVSAGTPRMISPNRSAPRTTPVVLDLVVIVACQAPPTHQGLFSYLTVREPGRRLRWKQVPGRNAPSD